MKVGLSDAIRALRQELVTAMADSQGAPVRFRVDSVKLNVEVAITAAAEAEGGVKFWVVSAGTKASGGVTSTHTISLELTAETDQGGSVLTDSGADVRMPS